MKKWKVLLHYVSFSLVVSVLGVPVAWDFMGMPDNHEYVWSVVHCTGSTFRFPSDVSGDFSGSRVGMCIISISELQKDSADTPGGSTSPGVAETGQKVFV